MALTADDQRDGPEGETQEDEPPAGEPEPTPADERDRMKDLLLADLDYIQQMYVHLNSKDKTISDLRHENEMLKKRIHRMGRRVSLTKMRNVHQKRSRLGSAGGVKKEFMIHDKSIERMGKRQRLEGEANDPARKKKKPKDEKKDHSDKEKKKKRNKYDGKELQVHNLAHSLKMQSEASIGPLLQRFSKLTVTSSAYYTSVGEKLTPMIPSSEPFKVTTLEVPKWTIKAYTSCFTIDGTENLSDDVFARRHFRLAIDEKRRKRWDVQRIREERRIEKLKERELKKNAKQEALNNPTPIQSFWPNPEEINDRLSLIVMEKIPVAVFGIPIPYSTECEPTLWWQNGKVQMNAKTKRRKR
ncbi:male-specific lethal 1-like 1 isoform X2 [Cimex lectularius]|uniref:PEHE domain-containing protein n=1 Tax=Cimex lectularius TaxID=79782 RepID=A0A8I6SPF9_CIMLE|nr:male-specific lethal 1-like 1 isoform X2 [Cimex lectularius]